jgi:nucleoside-diphosphate-sugar epimerase
MTQKRTRFDSTMPVTLVTGANGLIGYAVAQALTQSGMRAVGLSRRAPDAETPWESRIHDLLAPDAADAFSDLPLEAVVHCAATLPKQFGAADERLVAESNLRIDSAVFELSARRGCRVVFASTSGVYGSVAGVWFEDVLPQPQSPYAEAKVASELKMRAQGVQGGILRINAPNGARQRGMTVLRTFIEAAVAGRDLTYHGTGGRDQDFVATENGPRRWLSIGISWLVPIRPGLSQPRQDSSSGEGCGGRTCSTAPQVLKSREFFCETPIRNGMERGWTGHA